MFYRKFLEAEINLHPMFFGPKLQDTVRARVREEVEGNIVETYGYVVQVLDFADIGKGVIDSTTAYAKFTVKYNALLFRPFINEVCDVIVDSVNQMGFFASYGPFTVCGTQSRFPENLVLDHDLNAWVSSEDKSKPVIEAGTRMRLRITFATANAQMLAAVAAIDDDYLGPIGKSD